MKPLFLFATAALFAINVVALAQPTSRIQIRKQGETVATMGHLTGRLQVRADKSSLTAKNTTLLTGNVTITTKSDVKKTFHLRTDEAIVESDSIEIQVYAYLHDKAMGWVNTLGDTAGAPHVPGEAFLKALKAHPQVNSFRMNFGLLLAGDGSNSTVLYHRGEKTLKYYERGSGDDGRQRYTRHYLYTGVTDQVIEALFEKHSKTSRGYTHGYFDFLPEFGARRVKLAG